MLIRDILALCFVKLGYGTSVDMVTDANRSDEENRIVNILTRCAAVVYNEILTNHIPNIVKEKVVLTDNKVNLSTLSETKFVYAVALKCGGENRKIKQYPNYIESNFSGEAELEFVALADVTLDTDVPARIPHWLLADGIVAEYAYANNMIDVAVQTERKFYEGLTALKSKGAGRYVKQRRWE